MQTFTGREYLALDIANNYGLDKEDWSVRLHWFNKNKDQLETLVNQADEPALFYAGVQAYRAVERGEPIGHMISLDATSSGLQLLAALTGDRKAASICNVVNTGKREDAYTNVYETMCDNIGEGGKIERDMAKDAVMTSLYGSKAVPKQVFGEGALLDTFYHTMRELAPGAWELNEAFLDMWNPNALSHDWILPDNFHVQIKVMNQVYDRVHFLNQPFDVPYKVNEPMEEGRSLGANTIHSIDGMIVREITRRCDYDPEMIATLVNYLDFGPSGYGYRSDREKDKLVMALWGHYNSCGYLSARILDVLDLDNLGHVDAATIRELVASLPKKPFKVVAIHDCFRCLPHYANDLRKQYNLQLMMIAKSELLSYLVSQIMKKPVTIGKLDVDLYADIINTDYALS